MTKRILNLYVDAEDILLAKSRGMNLSQEFRCFLGVRLKNQELSEGKTDKEIIDILNIKNVQLNTTLENTIKENLDLKLQLQQERNKYYEEQQERLRRRRPL